ncbi:hypothetical protein GPALN_003707 [Globodera pallida]|nr:hypothetical protein GPALN_003707 [Globodera pallida]
MRQQFPAKSEWQRHNNGPITVALAGSQATGHVPTTVPCTVVEMFDAANTGPLSPRQEANSPEKMTSSFLISPAWYRDSDGRTGFRHDSELPLSCRLQDTPIKQNGTGIGMARQQSGTHCQSKGKDMTPTNNKQNQVSNLAKTFFCFKPCTSSSSSVPTRSCSISPSPRPSPITNPGGHLPPRPPPPGINKSPFLFLRLDAEKLTVGEGKAPAAEEGGRPSRRRNWGGKETRAPQRQKFVKFAETIKINEIAPREDGSIASSCSNTSNASSSSTLESLMEENGRVWPGKRQSQRTAQNDCTPLEELIEQFFHHCQSISTVDGLQQRPLYDNLQPAPIDGTATTEDSEFWLHAKTKVLTQRQRQGEAGELGRTPQRNGMAHGKSGVRAAEGRHMAEKERSEFGKALATRNAFGRNMGKIGTSEPPPFSRIPLPQSSRTRPLGRNICNLSNEWTTIS